jgi:hypothetical protein
MCAALRRFFSLDNVIITTYGRGDNAISENICIVLYPVLLWVVKRKAAQENKNP